MQIWFTSDFHLGHFNIIRYCNRPFKTLKEMDSTIIKNFNERVSEDDICYFLGDFCFRYAPSESPDAPKNSFDHYRNLLKCKNIIFFRGNHDKNNGVKSIIESMVIKYGGDRIYLTHDPTFAKSEFKLNFCGHVHEKWKFQKLNKKSIIVNLSIENWNYYPITINEIQQSLANWEKK